MKKIYKLEAANYVDSQTYSNKTTDIVFCEISNNRLIMINEYTGNELNISISELFELCEYLKKEKDAK